MKRITIYVAFLAAVSLLGSCKDMKDLSEPSSVDQVKTIQVDLGSVTKAVSESAVNDATLFVYQNNSKTGESVLYHQVYGPGSTFEVDLLFSDQTTYTYDIKAYANMGELAAEGGEVLFTGESESGLQLHGQSLSVGEADASAVTVDMSRYVGKVTVSKVAVDWTNDHGLQELKLVSMYLANVPAKVGGEAEYNVGGTYVPSAMDAFLYKPVDSVIGDGEAYTTAQSMYGYAGDAAIVLECELSGEKMYYHVPYSPEANTHRAFSFTIRQNGADTPLGELAQEALEVSVVTLNVLGYDESEGDVDFGEAGSDLTYNMVDLGLPSGLKWADRNVGAASPEDAGLYFQWGDIVGYTAEQVGVDKVFDWSDYFDTKEHSNGMAGAFYQYAEDKLTILEASDDAASVNMGSHWRMPTTDDLYELIDNTTLTFIDLQGNEFSQEEAENDAIAEFNLKGIKFTGSNNNSIFIPASGYYNNITYTPAGYLCCLWSSNLKDDNSMFAYSFNCSHSGDVYVGSDDMRCNGLSVRGVCLSEPDLEFGEDEPVVHLRISWY